MAALLLSAFLVEDRVDIRETLVEAIEEIAPVKFVGLADSEDAATRWLQTHSGDWDLAIVDLFLTQGTGFGVLKKCQCRRAGQKVVVLTSYCQPNLLQRCRELGADEIFDKSREVDKLVDFCKAHAQTLSGNSRPPP
ncbi:MAG: response regulator [Polaromonas sp.]